MNLAKRPLSPVYAVPSDLALPLGIAALLTAIFLGSIRYAEITYVVPATLEIKESVLLAGLFLVAAMSLTEFSLRPRISAAVIGAAFLFCGIIATVSLFALSQQAAVGQRDAFASASPWLYVIRRAVFPLFIIVYAWAGRARTQDYLPELRRVSAATVALLTALAAIAVAAIVVLSTPQLPRLIGSDAHTHLLSWPYWACAMLTLVALFMVLRIRRHTSLDLWIAVALWAFFIDLAGHLSNTTPFTVAFYVRRFEEISGVFAVLGFLIYYGFESYRTATVEADHISERRAEEQRRFAATVNSAAIGIAHVDQKGMLTFVNDELVRIARRPAGELLNRATIWELFGVNPKKLSGDRVARITSFEGSMTLADGSRVFVTTTITPSRRDEARPTYWIAIVHDVTMRKQAEETILQMSEIKSQFIATVTHEIRTPLSGIVGVSELLKRTTLTDKQRRFAETIDASAYTLLRLVNDVLDFSKMDSARIELDRALFDVVHLVESVSESFAAQASRRGLRLGVRISPALAGGFFGDSIRLRQVLDNLVNNAIKFTERGEISILAELEGDEGTKTFAVFRVTDTGIGIPAAERERIFDVFTQAEGATRRFGGSGLGLAIVRKLVEIMGGEIGVVSEEGRGSTFTVRIPLERETAGRRLDLQATSLRGLRCIVVAADGPVRDYVQSHLISWGMHVAAFDSVEGVLAELERNSLGAQDVHCVIVDGELPAASRIVQTLCDDHHFDDLQFIFMGTVPEAAAGVVSTWRRRLIRKPVSTSSLYDAIVQLCVSGAAREAAAHDRLALPPLRSERILIAEDNETNRMLALAQLEQLGFGADFIEDGAGAIAAAKTGLYSLILMDCQMPKVDGFDATRGIREFEAGKDAHIPIVAMTASTSPGYREKCLAAGMDDYLAKPVLLASLQAVIDRWLPRRPAETAGTNEPRPKGDREADFSRLRAIFRGDEAAVRKILDSALRSFDDGVEQLAEAISSRDSERVAKVAHRMAGVALDIDLAAIAATCRQIEADAGLDGAWPALEAAFDGVDGAIEAFRVQVATAKSSEVGTLEAHG